MQSFNYFNACDLDIRKLVNKVYEQIIVGLYSWSPFTYYLKDEFVRQQ